MKEKKVRASKKEKMGAKKDPKLDEMELRDTEKGDFDFGGIPKDAPFKRNIGCGG
ncbi:hypothetical protein [Roseivirga echinicomitans]|uniref:hypothetical protein n=1 Tax=Roseivirga echinicomitans TaxID=296218 RepID=UPI000AA24BCA|nr:hypothetical protein [Roseivirga echinicomitans]